MPDTGFISDRHLDSAAELVKPTAEEASSLPAGSAGRDASSGSTNVPGAGGGPAGGAEAATRSPESQAVAPTR